MILNLQKQVLVWVNKGLITQDQAAKILQSEQMTDKRPWVFYGIAGIGVTALLTGCISIVAANWEQISVSMKLFGYFFLQIALGLGVIYAAKRNNRLATDLLIVSFAGFFLVGIGLIGQIFHLRSDSWKAGVFWLGLTLAIFLNSRSRILDHVWIVASFVTGAAWMFSENNFGSSSDRGLMIRVSFLGCWPVILMCVSFIMALLNRERFLHLRSTMRNWAMVVHLLVTSLFAVFLWGNRRFGLEAAEYLIAPWICSLIAVALNYLRQDVSLLGRHFFAALLICIGVNVSIPALFDLTIGREWISILSAALFILVWAVAAATAAVMQRKLLFDLASLVIAFRFIVIYFEVFGDLSTTGIGLIITGLVILSVAVMWYRFHRRVAAGLSTGRLVQ